MLQSPSKFLSRPFLRTLLENRCLSPRGKEYCEHEVRDLLTEKEHRLALVEYNRELKERVTLIDHAKVIRDFQAQLVNSLNRVQEKTCQAVTPCEFSNTDTIFSLPENNSNALVIPTTASGSTSGLSFDSRKAESLARIHQQLEAGQGYGCPAAREMKGQHNMKKQPVSLERINHELEKTLAFCRGERTKCDKEIKALKTKAK